MLTAQRKKMKPKRQLEELRLIGKANGLRWECWSECKIFLEGSLFFIVLMKEVGKVYKKSDYILNYKAEFYSLIFFLCNNTITLYIRAVVMFSDISPFSNPQTPSFITIITLKI